MDREKTKNLIKNHSFVINDQVRFFPSRRIMEHMKTGTKVKLHVPASRCLDKLLQKQGSVVSQYELIQCGWGRKRETAVSSNTFYQCILHLRKNLAQMELIDVIETIPRHGIMFNDSVSVSIIQEDPLPFTNNETNPFKENQSEKSVENPSLSESNEALLENEDNSLSSSLSLPKASSEPHIVIAEKEKSKKLILYIPITILVLMNLSLYLKFAYINFTEDNIFDSYIKLPFNGCSIYAVDNRYSVNEIKNIMNSAGLSCSTKDTNFFTVSPMKSRINIIHCATHNKKKQNCRSVTIVDQSKEDHEI